ncbi:conserved domain protein [Candidatus Vecturithrix granuli]|uniref:Conserved domain protein n=1 Tax=Vecturithrix granuli TaxID=1499967 RepID=A0A081C9L0_VECG1|nr:conserved domain protein [Candidatus Vecturithrix granuli]
MNIPYVTRLAWVVTGLVFVQPALTAIHYENLTMIATALLIGSGFNLSMMSRMWLHAKGVSTLSYFFSDAKLDVTDAQTRYVKYALKVYNVVCGYFLVDGTFNHHTRLCTWIHGVCVLFDHVLKTNLQAICIVVLYYSDGILIKFPMCFRIYYQEEGKRMPWQRHKTWEYKKKYLLAADMLEWALDLGFPGCLVVADSWYGIGPFVKELKRLKLSYVLEIRASYTVKTPCITPKLMPTGRLAKHQIDEIALSPYFTRIARVIRCGFGRYLETGKAAHVLYDLKMATVRLKAIPGKHRLVESLDPTTQSSKYLLTNELTWKATKIVSAYSGRWVIEEFFRNAKQLTDMEGAMLRSEQGVTLSLCLVFWLDFLLHRENHAHCTAGTLSQESLTIPSIVRQAQYAKVKVFVEKVQQYEAFVTRWLDVEKQYLNKTRKVRKELIALEIADGDQLRLFA